jgi:hypothetical protein
MMHILQMAGGKSFEDTGPSVSVEWLGLQWSEAFWRVPFLHLSAKCLVGSSWFWRERITTCGNTSFIQLWKIRKVDSF